jgi:predicted RNA-binding protein with PIN domain
MGILAIRADERVKKVYFTEETITVDLMDGRVISVPLTWYPRLLNATSEQREQWEVCGGGYGIHWEEIDEDLSTEGMLRGAPDPRVSLANG